MRQLLTMTSGVKWNEDYTDVKSDVARMYAQPPDPGFDMTVSYVRKLPREAPPGTKWVYKTSETNLVGVLVAEATGKPLARVPVGKDLAPVRHGARRRMDDRRRRARAGRLLPRHDAARLRPLRPVHPRRRARRRPADRPRQLAR